MWSYPCRRVRRAGVIPFDSGSFHISTNNKTLMNETYQTNDECWLKELADKYVKLLDRTQFLSYKKEYSPSDFIASEHAKASEEMESVKKNMLEIINRK